MRRLRPLVVHATNRSTRTLSYQQGWPEALAADRELEAVSINLSSRASRAKLELLSRRRSAFDVVLLLHSVFSNSLELDGRALEAVRRLDAPKVYFIGNEYKLMPEKMAFAERLEIGLLVTQIASEQVQALYRARLGCPVVYIPNTGIDPEVFAPVTTRRERPVEIGYRAFGAPYYLGHDDRRRLPDAFLAAQGRLGLTLDVSLSADDRFDTAGWAAFLNKCRGTIGCEAGTDYFELDDRSRVAVNAYVDEHPDAGFSEVYEQYFRAYAHPVSGRALSGRVVEAASTLTAQLLMDGSYGGHFQPDEHYIPLRTDLSNLDEAVARLRDPEEADRVADAARAVALEEFTWPRLVGRLRDSLAEIR